MVLWYVKTTITVLHFTFLLTVSNPNSHFGRLMDPEPGDKNGNERNVKTVLKEPK